MNLGIGRLWAGTEDSLQAILEMEASLTPERVAELRKVAFAEDDEGSARQPRLLHKQGSIGIIQMRGSLVNGDSWLNEFFGLTGYGELRQALVAAAEDPEIDSIMLDVDSPGGAVAGMSDVADLVKQIRTNIKPIASHTAGNMCSAAYCIAGQAGEVSAGRMADVGSIGVLMVHREASRMMERMGITHTVIRSGEFKALGNPFEALSETALARLQASSDYSYGQFIDYVADARGVSSEYVKQHMAEGRVFTGEQARAAGLIDKVCTYDEAITSLAESSSEGLDKSGTGAQYGTSHAPVASNTSTKKDMKHMLNPVVQAAIKAAQVAEAKKTADASATKPNTEVVDPAADPAVDPATGPTAAATDAGEGSPATADTSTAHVDTAEVARLTAQVDVLKQDRADLQGQLTASTAKIQVLEASAEAAKKASSGMRAIAQKGVNYLYVALGMTAGAEQTMSDEQLLAEHTRLEAQFNANFKAGGVASVTATDVVDTQDDPAKQARIRAARLNRSK